MAHSMALFRLPFCAFIPLFNGANLDRRSAGQLDVRACSFIQSCTERRSVDGGRFHDAFLESDDDDEAEWWRSGKKWFPVTVRSQRLTQRRHPPITTGHHYWRQKRRHPGPVGVHQDASAGARARLRDALFRPPLPARRRLVPVSHFSALSSKNQSPSIWHDEIRWDQKKKTHQTTQDRAKSSLTKNQNTGPTKRHRQTIPLSTDWHSATVLGPHGKIEKVFVLAGPARLQKTFPTWPGFNVARFQRDPFSIETWRIFLGKKFGEAMRSAGGTSVPLC